MPQSVLETVRARRDELAQQRAAIVEAAETAEGGPRDLTETEWTEFRALGEQVSDHDTRVADLEAEEQRRAAGDENRRDTGGRGGRVTNEPDLYRSDVREYGFLSDMYRSQHMGDWQARERLQRHGEHERARLDEAGVQLRAVGTGNLAGLIPPQYLVDLYAPLLHEGRVTADLCRGLQLPATGMTLTIPKATTGTAVAPQVNENTALVTQDIAANDLVVPVRTIGGGTEVSRQSLERAEFGVDELAFADLAAEYAVEINEEVLFATGAAGTMKGILSAAGTTVITYTSGTPDPVELWKKIAGAIAAGRRARKLPLDAIIMTPERWAFFETATNDEGIRLVTPAAPSLGTSNGELSTLTGLVGTMHGLPVYVDALIPINAGAGTNEDAAIVVARRADLLLWEEGDGTPRELRFEQPKGNQLTVQLFLYGYAAFTAERYPTAVTKIGGTGLVQPTF